MEFWDALDAIGIDAYFPVALDENPDLLSVQSAWTFIPRGGQNHNWFADIRAKHEQFNKPVIFTEIGFLSCNGAGIEPWKYPCERGVDLDEQAVLYEGTLRFWKDVEWMQGYLWWRWDDNPDEGGPDNGDYLVQNKQPTLEVLQRFWTASVPVISVDSVSGGPEAESRHSTSPTASPSSPSSSSSGSTTTVSIPSNPSTPPLFAYGKPRLRILDEERARAWELAQALKSRFNGSIPLHRRHWPIYINAYIYGSYSVDAIARAIELSGKTVHPSIPWTAWRRSGDYQRSMR